MESDMDALLSVGVVTWQAPAHNSGAWLAASRDCYRRCEFYQLDNEVMYAREEDVQSCYCQQ